MSVYSSNLKRLMASQGLTIKDLASKCRLNERTLKGLLSGTIKKPHPRTVYKLSSGLGVSVDEVLGDSPQAPKSAFDRLTNPAVDAVIASHPRVFEGWTSSQFDELYSRFGHGGPLTAEGALEAAVQMNGDREVLRKAALILETGESQLLAAIVELLYDRVQVRPSGRPQSEG